MSHFVHNPTLVQHILDLFPKQRLRGGVLTFDVHKLADDAGNPVAGGRVPGWGWRIRWPVAGAGLGLDRLVADAMAMGRGGFVSLFAGVLSCILA